MKPTPPVPDIATLLDSWELHLRAERKSAETVKNYTAGVRQLLAWCAEQDRPAVLDRSTVNAFVADLLDAGAEAATARARQLGCAGSRHGWQPKTKSPGTSCSASNPPSWTPRSYPG